MRFRSMLLFCLFGLVVAACGARLTEEQRAMGVGVSDSAAPGESSPVTAGDQGDAVTPRPVDGSSAGSSDTTVGTVPADEPGTGTAEGAEIAPPGSQDAPSTSAPAGGNGGATDVGVSGNSIKLAVISDRTGPVPGLFEGSVRAMNAWAGMINSQGGIHGRQIELLILDARTDAGANRAAALQACEEAFAIVGSTSVTDQGGAPVVEDCGIPDISGSVISPERARVPNVYSVLPNNPDELFLGSAQFVREQNPEAVKKAAMLWADTPAAETSARRIMAGYESLGYEFIYERAVAPVEPNYTPLVIQMQSAGVEWVTMLHEQTNIARLEKAFRQQNYSPEVREWTVAVYDQRFLDLAGDAANGSQFAISFVPFEEASSNEEMSLYFQWLESTGNAGKHDYFGLYGWSAGRLFEQLAQKIGPDLTRDKLLTAVAEVHEWDGHGIHAPHDVGGRHRLSCFVNMVVEDGRFTRQHPSTGFECGYTGVFNG